MFKFYQPVLYENREDIRVQYSQTFHLSKKRQRVKKGRKKGVIIKCWEKTGNDSDEKTTTNFPATDTELVLFLFLSALRLSDLRARYQRAACHSFCVAVVIYSGEHSEQVLSVTRISGSVCMSAALRGNNVIIARGKWLERNLSTILCLENDEYTIVGCEVLQFVIICYGRFLDRLIEMWKYEDGNKKDYFLMKCREFDIKNIVSSKIDKFDLNLLWVFLFYFVFKKESRNKK